MAGGQEPERPLLGPEQPTESYGATASTAPRRTSTWHVACESSLKTPREVAVVDAMTYRAEVLTDWRIFVEVATHHTFPFKNIAKMMGRLVALSLAIAVLVLTLVPDPNRLRASRFREIGTFLQVFVGLLLGFFMSSSVNRWYQCVDGFMHLFDSVRTLQMQFHALGVGEESRNKALRYGVLSGHILSEELKLASLPKAEYDKEHDLMWDNLLTRPAGPGNIIYATKDEVDILRTVDEPSSCVWMWVSSMLGRMAMEGEVPAMQTPTWGRLMAFVETAHSSIRDVKTAIAVQAPFMYVQMLALLVHLNNIINAISLGITCGITVGSVMMHNSFLRTALNYQNSASGYDVLIDCENMTVTVFINFIGPLIYQSLLEVSLYIAEPFKHERGNGVAAAIPIARLLGHLERDMHDVCTLATNPPAWPCPNFQFPPKKPDA